MTQQTDVGKRKVLTIKGSDRRLELLIRIKYYYESKIETQFLIKM